MVNALLQIVAVDFLRDYVPVGMWGWLKKRPSLLPGCPGPLVGTAPDVVRHVWGLGHPETLKLYFLVVRSECVSFASPSLDEMVASIREDFGGVGMRRHREDLTERLDHVLARLDLGLGYFKRHRRT